MCRRTKLADRRLPNYTRGEEIFNMASHIVGGALGGAALTLCVVFAAVHGNVFGIVSGAVYGVALIVLYTMSSIYHGMRPKPRRKAKKVMQILDHCAVYLLIAGTYTPIALVGLRGADPVAGWAVLGVIWGAAAIGITLSAIDLGRYKKFELISYLAMGWCIVVRADLLPEFLPSAGITLLLAGGIAYTAGAIFYGVGVKKRYAHSLFHILTVVGSILHFLCVLLYLM